MRPQRKNSAGSISPPHVQVFSGRMGSMRKALKSRAEFIFMDAPHGAKGEEAEIRATGGTEDHPRTWWHWEVHPLHAAWAITSKFSVAL